MKTLIRLVLITCLLFPVSDQLMTHASAQGWVWGRWNTGAGIDSWPVATDNFGNVFAGGFIWGTSSTTTFGSVTLPANFQTTSCVVKYDASGNVLWAKGNTVGDAYIINLATDPSGNVIMFGTFDSPTFTIDALTLNNPTGGYQFFLVKFDPLGNVLWGKNDGEVDFMNSALFLSGCSVSWMLGTGSVVTDASGNIFITSTYAKPTISIGGTTLTNADPTGATQDIYIAKYTSSGTFVWAKSYGGTGNDDAYGITVTPAGDIYNTGAFSSPSITFGPSTVTNPSSSKNMFVARYNSSGVATWATSAGGSSCAFGAGIISDASSNVYVTGGYSSPSISFGPVTISKTYPANSALAEYLIQLSPANNVTWSKTIGSVSGATFGYCIALASCGEVWVSGNFRDSCSIDGHTLRAPANSPDPVFLAGYNLTGGVVGYSALQSGGDDQNGIACDAAGNIYLCSDVENFGGTSGLYPVIFGADTIFTNPSTGIEYLYVAKYQNLVAPPDTIFKHSDTTLCSGDSVLLGGPAGYTFHHWNTGSFDSSIYIHTPGNYWVFCIGTCSTPFVVDTFHVTFASQDTTYQHSADTICANQVLTLNAPDGYPNYLWSNASTGSSLTVDTTGVFWVLATGPCNLPYIFDTFHIVHNPLDLGFNLGNDTLACEPVTIKIPEIGYGLSYLWSDGSTRQTFTANHTGTYVAKVSLNGCSAQDSIHVTILDLRQQINDTLVCVDSPFHISLKANAPQGSVVLWSTGSNEPSIVASTPGIYWVRVTDSVCSGFDSMQVLTQYCNCWCQIPSGFTPNDDGLNDHFQPIIDPNCMAGGYIFSVYDRWGQCVYTSSDRKGYWDGKFNGVPLDIGVYMYMVSFYGGIPYQHFNFKGDVTLIR